MICPTPSSVCISRYANVPGGRCMRSNSTLLLAVGAALVMHTGAVSAASLDPMGTETTLLSQAAMLQLDAIAAQLTLESPERAALFHEQRRLDSEQNDPLLPLYEGRMTARMTGLQAVVSDVTRMGFMLTDLSGDADFIAPDDALVTHGIGLSGFLRRDYKGLKVDTTAGLTHMETRLTGATMSSPFTVQPEHYVRFLRVQGSFDFTRDHWTYGPVAGIDAIEIESQTAGGAGVTLEDQTESFTRYRMGARVTRIISLGEWTLQPGLSALWFTHQDKDASTPTVKDDQGILVTPRSDRRPGTHPSAEATLAVRHSGGLSLRAGVWSSAGDDDRRQKAVSASIMQAF